MISFDKNFFILVTYLFISSCHEKDYDNIEEAKNFLMKDQLPDYLKKTDNIEYAYSTSYLQDIEQIVFIDEVFNIYSNKLFVILLLFFAFGNIFIFSFR